MRDSGISADGLFGLVVKIEKQLKQGKTLDEVLPQYPVSKTVLPYLLTLVEEVSVFVLDLTRDYGELESKNNTLKEQIKRLESKKGVVSSVDIEKLQNELKRLKNENLDLKEKVSLLTSEKASFQEDYQELSAELQRLEIEVQNYLSFFDNSLLASLLFKNFLRKIGK